MVCASGLSSPGGERSGARTNGMESENKRFYSGVSRPKKFYPCPPSIKSPQGTPAALALLGAELSGKNCAGGCDFFVTGLRRSRTKNRTQISGWGAFIRPDGVAPITSPSNLFTAARLWWATAFGISMIRSRSFLSCLQRCRREILHGKRLRLAYLMIWGPINVRTSSQHYVAGDRGRLKRDTGMDVSTCSTHRVSPLLLLCFLTLRLYLRPQRPLAEAVACVLLRLFDHVTFAGGEEEVRFEAVLAGVEVEVAASEGEEGFVGAAFDDVSAFDD